MSLALVGCAPQPAPQAAPREGEVDAQGRLVFKGDQPPTEAEFKAAVAKHYPLMRAQLRAEFEAGLPAKYPAEKFDVASVRVGGPNDTLVFVAAPKGQLPQAILDRTAAEFAAEPKMRGLGIALIEARRGPGNDAEVDDIVEKKGSFAPTLGMKFKMSINADRP